MSKRILGRDVNKELLKVLGIEAQGGINRVRIDSSVDSVPKVTVDYLSDSADKTALDKLDKVNKALAIVNIYADAIQACAKNPAFIDEIIRAADIKAKQYATINNPA